MPKTTVATAKKKDPEVELTLEDEEKDEAASPVTAVPAVLLLAKDEDKPVKAAKAAKESPQPKYADYAELEEEQVDPIDPRSVWDGMKTRVRLAHPMMRNHTICGPGTPCIDCLEADPTNEDTTHQFHIAASRDAAGFWHGPESIHMEDLIVTGVIARTKAAKDRELRQSMVDGLRGTHGTPDRPEGHPEYKELTTERLRGIFRHQLQGGPKAVRNREHAEARSGVEELLDALKGGLAGIFGGAGVVSRRTPEPPE